MTKPLLSIIVPVHNAREYIAECLESVLQLGDKNYEVIIIDDGSTNDTYEWLEDLCKNDSRVKLFKNEQNMGLQKTLNKG